MELGLRLSALIAKAAQSGLLTRIVMTESVTFCDADQILAGSSRVICLVPRGAAADLYPARVMFSSLGIHLIDRTMPCNQA
jgi:hypothetical protein